MSLKIGIIGLPNVGKSTLFNALTGAQTAVVANYPFCTINPNHAIVPVPDDRLEALQRMVSVSKRIHSTIEFVDIAGLVQGASKGEGLGNKFLGNIRNTDVLLHIVRCFQDSSVSHVSGSIDPVSDVEVINLELIMADLQQLEKKIDRLLSQAKGDREILPILKLAERIQSYLQSGTSMHTFPELDDPHFGLLNNELRFLSLKPVIFIANVDEASIATGNEYVSALTENAVIPGTEVVILCARYEEEIIALETHEIQEYLDMVGLKEQGLGKVVRLGFEYLNLISFFTKNEKEVRAWNITDGTKAPQAAGRIHTDFERGFIKAEVIAYHIFEQYGSELTAREAGKIRLEGKDYKVMDGDIIYFRFNV